MERLKYLYRAYRYRYKLDRTELGYITGSLKKGDTAADIGSHKGGYLYWMQKSVGPAGRVFGFEPQPILFKYLQNIKQIFDFKHVTLENLGLSSTPGLIDFYIPLTQSGSSPGAHIDRPADGETYNTVQVKTATLDDYFFARGIFPGLLKIDVEGHEKQVLNGGTELLKACWPRIIMECENRHQRSGDVFDVFEILTRLGYTGYFIHQNRIRPLAEFDPEKYQQSGAGSFWEAQDYVNNFIFEP